MKHILYYDFVPSGIFTGTVLAPVSGSEDTVLSGDKSQPGNTLKLAAGPDAWSQEVQSVIRGDLNIQTLHEADWTPVQKLRWVTALCKHITPTLPSDEALSEIMNTFDSENLFELLSGVSLAYVETDISSGEVSIGVNVYPLTMESLMENGSDEIRLWLARYYPDSPVLVSHAFRVGYRLHTEIVWCFGGELHPYITTTPGDLVVGGGNYFGEVKLAASALKASYTIKKNVDPLDPTGGLYSGTNLNLNIGDKLHLLDTSVHTSTDENGVWSWVGDYKQIPFVWHIAEITYKYEDYKNFPTHRMHIPIEVLQNNPLDEDFNLAPQTP